MKKQFYSLSTVIWPATVVVLAVLLGWQTWRASRLQQEARALGDTGSAGGNTSARHTVPGSGRQETGPSGKKPAAVTGKNGSRTSPAAMMTADHGRPLPAAAVTGARPAPTPASADTGSAYSFITQAKDALDRGDNAAAITLLNQALEKDPANAGAYLMLAGICRNLGLLEEERQLYLDWSNSAPQTAMPHYHLANFYQQQGRLDEAAAEARQFLALGDPNDINTYLLGANLFRGAKLPDEERKMLEAWVAAKPQLADSHRALAEFYQRSGNDAAAQAEYQAALGAAPGRWEINLQLATLYQKMQKYPEAEAVLIQAANLKPTDMWIRLRLADSYRMAGNQTAAAEVYRQIINYTPESAEGKMAASRLNALPGSGQ